MRDDTVIPMSGDWSHWPPVEPPELASAKNRATEMDGKRFRKAVNAIERAIRARLARLKVTVREIDEHERAVADADERIAQARSRLDRRVHLGRRGATGRSLPTWLYALAAVGFYAVMLVVDRGALMALGLSLGLTAALAIAVPAVDLLCAHTAGGYLWRRQEAISSDVEISPGEHAMGIGSFVLGVLHALVVGLVRGLRSGLLGGLLFCIVSLALFAGMTYLAYRHADDDADELAQAKRARWWATRRAQERERRAEKEAAKVRTDGRRRVGLASERVARWDAAVASGTFAAGERLRDQPFHRGADPAWVEEERRIAASELPDHLLPFDAREWVRSDARHRPAGELNEGDNRRSA